MHSSIIQTVSEQLQSTDNESIAKWGTVSAIFKFPGSFGKIRTRTIRTNTKKPGNYE